MTLQVHHPDAPVSLGDRLEYARQIILAEAQALTEVAGRLDDSLTRAADLLYASRGRIAVTGTGKSADVGQKIAGTFSSTGTRAYVLDATRAAHGDLGMLHPDDIVLALSHSGESDEIVRLLGPFRELTAGLVALTGNAHSSLARHADVALVLGPLTEVCPLGLAPSTSTTAMLAVGDALAFVLNRMRGFGREDFARLHPAGSLGRKLLKVEAVMRRDPDLRIAEQAASVRAVFAAVRRRGRRTGAVMLTDPGGRLTGLFTDSDLARLFEQRKDDALDRPIADVMTPTPLTVPLGTRVLDAVEVMRRHKISELPVVDGGGRPVGLLDITDLIALAPPDQSEALAQVA